MNCARCSQQRPTTANSKHCTAPPRRAAAQRTPRETHATWGAHGGARERAARRATHAETPAQSQKHGTQSCVQNTRTRRCTSARSASFSSSSAATRSRLRLRQLRAISRLRSSRSARLSFAPPPPPPPPPPPSPPVPLRASIHVCIPASSEARQAASEAPAVAQSTLAALHTRRTSGHHPCHRRNPCPPLLNPPHPPHPQRPRAPPPPRAPPTRPHRRTRRLPPPPPPTPVSARAPALRRRPPRTNSRRPTLREQVRVHDQPREDVVVHRRHVRRRSGGAAHEGDRARDAPISAHAARAHACGSRMRRRRRWQWRWQRRVRQWLSRHCGRKEGNLYLFIYLLAIRLSILSPGQGG